MNQTLHEFAQFLIDDAFLSLSHDEINVPLVSNIIVSGSSNGALSHVKDHDSVAYHNFLNYFYNPAILNYARTIIQEPITRSSIQDAILNHLKLKFGKHFHQETLKLMAKKSKNKINYLGIFSKSNF